MVTPVGGVLTTLAGNPSHLALTGLNFLHSQSVKVVHVSVAKRSAKWLVDSPVGDTNSGISEDASAVMLEYSHTVNAVCEYLKLDNSSAQQVREYLPFLFWHNMYRRSCRYAPYQYVHRGVYRAWPASVAVLFL